MYYVKRLTICFCLLCIFYLSNAQGGQGSCDCKRFNLPEQGKIDYTWTVKVNRDGVPLFPTATSTNPSSYLRFNTNFNIIEAYNDKLLVQRHEDMQPLGWVKREDLLCALKPLRSISGLDTRFYIKTATKIRADKPSTVKAYISPDSQDCGKTGCRELARFEGYFIFDDKNGRFLLADAYNLRPETRLIGWVEAEDGFIWDTAYGLRPRENFVFPQGHPKAGQERVLYAYLSKEEALQRRNGRPVLGGDRWYKYALRIPILDRKDNLFKVVMPLAGVGVSRSDAQGRIIITGESYQGTEKAIQNILNIKNIDVFFLIDGTRSIEPYLLSIQKVVKQLKHELEKNDALGVINSRFGFGIYRDAYAEETELGFWYSFPETCKLDRESIEQNHQRFLSEMDMVIKAMFDYRIKGDKDFEENVFGGMTKVIDHELSNCPDRLKILFVIGDHGYSPDNQKKLYKRDPISIDTVINGLHGDKNQSVMPVVTFFIQTPYKADQTAKLSKKDCKKAYQLFSEQAHLILNELQKYTRFMKTDNYFFNTNETNLPDKVIASIKSFINPSAVSAVNEIILDLRGGASLADTIERWQNYEEFNNLPGLFWDLIETAGCRYLGDQCSHRIMDTILEGYFPVSNDIEVDIWSTAEDLRKYRTFIENVKDSGEYHKGKYIRNELVHALITTLRQLVPSPPPFETGETLKDYVKRISHLPVRQDSPLFNYTIQDLENPSVVPDCEIERLNTWISNVNQFLYHIADNKRPEFETRRQPGTCPGGRLIPYVVPGSIRGRHFRDSNMSYSHALGNTTIYWIPKMYLP